jgi:hypothetical protein
LVSIAVTLPVGLPESLTYALGVGHGLLFVVVLVFGDMLLT